MQKKNNSANSHLRKFLLIRNILGQTFIEQVTLEKGHLNYVTSQREKYTRPNIEH